MTASLLQEGKGVYVYDVMFSVRRECACEVKSSAAC